MKIYPSSVSRTLSPDNRGLVTVVGRHDYRLSDADINLVQDLQDLKRQKIIENTAFSGCLTRSPLRAIPDLPLKFEVPAFNFLFAGEVLEVAGNESDNLTTNYVSLPPPTSWSKVSKTPEAAIYVVFLEMWFKNLNPETGEGFYMDPADLLHVRKFFYNGCVNCLPSKAIEADLIDPFQNIYTTGRAQLQWGLRVASIPLSYDFSKFRAGLDPGLTPEEEVYGRGAWAGTVAGMAIKYRFESMGKINGDFGLWRAGDGNPYNGLGTMDGYSYAAPVALVFQRNSGNFSIEENPFGCAEQGVSASGLKATRNSGRWDGRFADVVYPEDIVDTRMSVSLSGYDLAPMMEQGLVDLYMGSTTLKVARGESPTSPTLRKALGSKLNYYVSVSDHLVPNSDTLPGEFDGFSNGFSSDARTFYSTRRLTVQDKVARTKGAPWAIGDILRVKLGPASPANNKAQFTFCLIQAYSTTVTGTVLKKEPVVLYGSVIRVDGLNTGELLLNFVVSPTEAGIDLKSDDIYVTVGVRYEAGSRFDLRKVPESIDGGVLFDAALNRRFPVFGVSEYEISAPLTSPVPNTTVTAFNPTYSTTKFGTRVTLPVMASVGKELVDQSAGVTTTFIINRRSLASKFTGIMVNSVYDTKTKLNPPIKSQMVKGDNLVVVLRSQLARDTTLLFTITCLDTAQASFVPAVKGITQIEEVVLVGQGQQGDFTLDPRVRVLGTATKDSSTYIYLAAENATLKGIAATDDGVRKIWIYDTTQVQFVAYDAQVEVFGGIMTVRIDSALVNINAQKFFFLASMLPALASPSYLNLGLTYIPYQGEGIAGREYSVLYSSPTATVTTNGTGQAPVAGIKDAYPFNRSLPISTLLPCLEMWSDGTLANQPMAGEFDGNYYAKRYSNTEHTFEVRLHTNDFIEPLHGYKRKKVKLVTRSGGRGFSRALPHVGFAVKKPQPKQILGDNLQTTIAPVVLYVNNKGGSDNNDGFTKATARRTIQGCLSLLPPVLRHPVSIILVDTGEPFNLKTLPKTAFSQALVGDGEPRAVRYYCLGNIAFTMQEQARLTIGRETSNPNRVEITCPSDFLGFGDGAMTAFYVAESRVLFNGIKFTGFRDFASKVTDSDVEFMDCEFAANRQAVAADQGSMVTFNKGVLAVQDLAIGVALDSSSARFTSTTLQATPGKPADVFILAERNSNVTLSKHDGYTHEKNIMSSTLIVKASAGSTVVCEPTWNSTGKAKLTANSTMFRAVDAPKNAFSGGIDPDSSSSVVSAL